MAGITKNFIVKNGLEVNGGLLIANTDSNKVGIGTTVLSHDFNVKGGIGVTNAIVTGITTVNEFKSTYSQLGVATASYYRVGTTTVFETSGGLVSLSGIQTVDATTKVTFQNQLFGQTTIGGLVVTGVATLSSRVAIGGSLDVDGQGEFDDINVSGVSTFVGIATHQNTLFGTQLSLSGISTLPSVRVGSAVTINSTGIDAVGIATLSRFVKVTNVDQGGGLFAGIITAANGGQKIIYFGDGSNLTGVNANPNLGVSTAGGFIGAGVTLLNFLGSGISSVFVNSSVGIATINISGGAATPGGSNTQVQFNNSGVLGGSSNFTFDGTGATIGTSRFNGSGINAGIITATSFSGSGSGITGLTNSNLSGSAGITNANLANSTISGVSLGSNLNSLTLATSGTGLSGSASYNGSSGQTFTVTSNATSANTVSTIVARDASGNFNAGIITATFSGNVTGNVTSTTTTASGSATVGSAVTITSGGVDTVGVSSALIFNVKDAGSYRIAGTDVITGTREVQKVVLNNYAEKLNAFGNTGLAPTINLANGTFVTATLNQNATFAFSLGTGVTSDAIQFTLHLTNDATAGRTITWPVSVKWPNGTVPTRTTTANKTDVYSFYTFNGGTDWYGILSIYNYS